MLVMKSGKQIAVHLLQVREVEVLGNGYTLEKLAVSSSFNEASDSEKVAPVLNGTA
jgi:acid stress-induced BolA-like protein IbaG/YrbA